MSSGDERNSRTGERHQKATSSFFIYIKTNHGQRQRNAQKEDTYVDLKCSATKPHVVLRCLLSSATRGQIHVFGRGISRFTRRVMFGGYIPRKVQPPASGLTAGHCLCVPSPHIQRVRRRRRRNAVISMEATSGTVIPGPGCKLPSTVLSRH